MRQLARSRRSIMDNAISSGAARLRDASQYVIVIRQAGGKFSLRNCRRGTHSRNFYAAIFMTRDVQSATTEPFAFAPRKCTDLTQSRIDRNSSEPRTRAIARKWTWRCRLRTPPMTCSRRTLPRSPSKDPHPPRFRPLILSTAEE